MLPARSPRGVFAVLLGALAGCALMAAPARSAGLDDLKTSLRLIPADAAFYSSMLRNKEQVDLVANSRAWAKIWSMPSVVQGRKYLEKEYKRPGGSFAVVRQLLDDEDNQELVALLTDMVSDEIFTYGDNSWIGFFDLYQDAYSTMQYQPLTAKIEGETGDRDATELQERAVLSVLAKDLDRIKVPNLVVGFKLSDAKRAENQIKRLESLADALSASLPKLKGHVKREKVGDASFLTLTIDGSQVPWNSIPWDKLEDKPGEFKALRAKLKAMTLTISLGVHHDYLMLGIGASADHLARLGGAGPRLDQQAEFKPLAKFADRKLTGISYNSKEFLKLGAQTRYVDNIISLAKAGMAKADLSEEQRKAVLKDLTDFTKGVQAAGSEVGPTMAFSFMTDRGFEGYAYDHGKHAGLDGSKPLTLLDHLGGDPLVAVAARGKVSVKDYEEGVKRIKKAFGQLDEIAKDKLTGEDKERYEKGKADFLPLLERLNETTAKLFLPAMADGQCALVIDAKWKSKRWSKAMPELETAMPGPEIGLVFGVSNAESLRKAMAEYRVIVNDALAKIRTWPGAEKFAGDFQIPEPKSLKEREMSLYFYPLPEEWGIDSQISPTAGLTDKVAVLTASKEHAERLLSRKPLKVDGGPLADGKRPMVSAAYCDWAGIVDALTPWVELGTNKALESQQADMPAKTREGVVRQVRTVLQVLKCFRGATSATTLEDGVLTTHSEAVFRDLEK
jgi:hypothetical protein